jgi:hypothetical protein
VGLFIFNQRQVITILLLLAIHPAYAQVQETNQVLVAKEFIQKVKLRQKDLIAAEMHFPLRRHYPLPDIKSAAEFCARYDEVFDDSLSGVIMRSDPAKDWSQVGWRGVMLQNGILWLDDDGILVAVNYESLSEQKQRLERIELERQTIHPSLRNFITPKPGFSTYTYTIRIDEVKNNYYRMAIWPKDTPMSQKPFIVIEKGKWIPEGSGGNNRFEFRYHGRVYTCSEILMGEDDSPPGEFVIMKGKKEILKENALILRR